MVKEKLFCSDSRRLVKAYFSPFFPDSFRERFVLIVLHYESNCYFVIGMVVQIFIPEGQTLSLLEILQIVSTVSKFSLDVSHICLKLNSSCSYFIPASNFTYSLKF